jgi:acetyl esterase/lipase
MTYAPGIAEYVDRANAALPPDFHTRPLVEQRALYDGLSRAFPFERPAGVDVRDERLRHDGRAIRVRVYRPATAGRTGLVVYLHGGGFVLGSVESHDSVAAELAARAGHLTIAVDFPLAPEHPFPAAVEECYGALCAAVAQADRLGFDPDRVCLAGDSSGANLAVVVAMVARDRGGPPVAAQALVSPVLDFARWRTGGEDSPRLSGDEMAFFTRCYVGGNMDLLEHPYVSPLRHGRFDDLPPAYVWASERDSLCADALAYADRLRSCGTPAQVAVEPGFTHACLRARGMSPAVADAWERFCAGTARLLAAAARTGGER